MVPIRSSPGNPPRAAGSLGPTDKIAQAVAMKKLEVGWCCENLRPQRQTPNSAPRSLVSWNRTTPRSSASGASSKSCRTGFVGVEAVDMEQSIEPVLEWWTASSKVARIKEEKLPVDSLVVARRFSEHLLRRRKPACSSSLPRVDRQHRSAG